MSLDSSPSGAVSAEPRPGVDLYWLPLGAGGRFVRLNGRLFEAVSARLERRAAKDLYHTALAVGVPEGVFTIEMAWPVPDGHGERRGVVAEGAVGSRRARALRSLRYEIRRWRNGVIPDCDEAVDSPRRLTDDPSLARRILELVPEAPTPVWGRDELGAGEMWNSNSLISWLIARGGLDVDAVRPPAGGRAPGWRAGVVVARRRATAPAQDEGALPDGERPIRGNHVRGSGAALTTCRPETSRVEPTRRRRIL